MPTLRIYFNSYIEPDLKEIETNLLGNRENFAEFDNEGEITRGGFYKAKIIFTKIENSNYFIANFIIKESSKVPSRDSELLYFNLIRESSKKEETEYFYPILIKLIINMKKRILCFFNKKVVKNDKANEILIDLHSKYGFNFKYPLLNNHFRSKKGELNGLLAALGTANEFTKISLYDQDNILIAENREKLTETIKINEFIKNIEEGKPWRYIQLLKEDLEFEMRLSNDRTQNFITFVNDYRDDAHLVKIVDFLLDKISETTEFETTKQIGLDWYFKNKK
ncbi:MAG: hypothetical protein ACFFAN_04055 [Promethearchaeota archaeon]